MIYYEKYENVQTSEWVVFVHGAGGSTKTFKRQIDAFSEKYNLLLCDLRDHGNSKDLPLDEQLSFSVVAKDIIELMEFLQIKKAHFVGISMGTIIIRIIENLRPDLVKSEVLGGGVFGLTHKISGLLRSGVIMSKMLPFSALSKILAKILMPKDNHKRSRDIFVREARRVSQEAVERWVNLVKELKNLLRLYFQIPISVPCLILMGEEDHVFIDPARRYQRKNRNVKLKVIKNCGHVCNIEKFEEFNKLSLAFLTQEFPEDDHQQQIGA